jgi:hypothetical protein
MQSNACEYQQGRLGKSKCVLHKNVYLHLTIMHSKASSAWFRRNSFAKTPHCANPSVLPSDVWFAKAAEQALRVIWRSSITHIRHKYLATLILCEITRKATEGSASNLGESDCHKCYQLENWTCELISPFVDELNKSTKSRHVLASRENSALKVR